jgi:hypothetical protein
VALPALRPLRQHFAGPIDDDLIEALVPEEGSEREEELANDAGIGIFRHPLPYFVTRSDFG